MPILYGALRARAPQARPGRFSTRAVEAATPRSIRAVPPGNPLDLVISYLEQGKTAEVRGLADEIVIVFRDLGVSREALAALLLFQEAARRETGRPNRPATHPTL